MKCISCGSEIPEGSTSCPFCGNTVLPTNHNVVNGDAQMNMGVPTTPETPVLPQDQNLTMPNMEAQNTSATSSIGQMESVQPSVSPMENQSMGQMASPNVANTMSTPSVPPMGDAMGQNNLVQNTGVPTPPPMPNASPSMTVEQPVSTPQTISNQGEINDGVKIASTAAPVIEKKNNKKLLIIIIIVVAIIAIAAGFGIYYYMSQYKSADKRIDAVFSGMNRFAASLKADKVESKSGTFDLGFSFDYDKTSFNGKVDGKYAYDLEKKIMDYGINISTLDMKNDGEELKLIDKDPLKLELYTADSKAYILLENFYENYIYSDIEGYDDLFNGIEQNDINYTLIVQGGINAIKSGLKSASNTQTVKEVTLDGKTQKANVVTIILNKANKQKITNVVINNLKNNTALLEEVAKLSDTTADELKKELEDALKETEYSDESATMEIITNTKGTSLLGIRVYDDEAKFELASVVNGYKLSFKEKDKDVFNITYTSTTTTNSTVKETSSKIKFTCYDDDNKLIKMSLETTVKDDINPKVEKINTKNSVNANNISVEDQQKILNNVYNFGNLGLLIQSMLGDLMNPITPDGNPNYSVNPGTSAPIVNQPMGLSAN